MSFEWLIDLDFTININSSHANIDIITDAADLLVDGGIARCGGQPHLLVELITDGVRDVDAGVCVSTEDRPARGRKFTRLKPKENSRSLYASYFSYLKV